MRGFSSAPMPTIFKEKKGAKPKGVAARWISHTHHILMFTQEFQKWMISKVLLCHKNDTTHICHKGTLQWVGCWITVRRTAWSTSPTTTTRTTWGCSMSCDSPRPSPSSRWGWSPRFIIIIIIILGGAGHQDRPLLPDCERGQDCRVLRRVDLEQEVPGGR